MAPGRLGLARLLSAALNRDGQAAQIQSEALAEGQALASATLQANAAAVPPGARVALRSPRAEIDDVLAQKVLRAWLQNRYQTLYPLALNLRLLTDDKVRLLMEAMASALLASDERPAGRVEQARDWLGSVGASDVQRGWLDEALASPRPLPLVLSEVLAARLGPFAYAVSLAALDQRNLVNRLFLDYLAARLAIPSDVSRSLSQRYRL